MSDAIDKTAPGLPPPPIGLGALLFGILAAPIAWSGVVLANFGLSSHFCFPDGAPLPTQPDAWGWTWWVIVAIAFVALLITAAGFWTAWRSWTAVRYPPPLDAPAIASGLVDRVRFFAIAGLIFSGLFFAATIFEIFNVFLVPQCAY